jgi:hypothetical protein
MEVEEPQQDKDDALQLQQLSYYKKWARRLAKARPRALSVAEILASQQLLVTGLPDGTTEVLSAVCYTVITFQSKQHPFTKPHRLEQYQIVARLHRQVLTFD